MVVLRSFVALLCGMFVAEGRDDSHSSYVINVKPPREDDAVVMSQLDQVTRETRAAQEAANEAFAEGKRKMLDAEKAELRRIVRNAFAK